MKTAYILLAWFGVVLGLSLAGIFDVAAGTPPLLLLLAITTPILVYAIDWSFFNGVLFDGIHQLERPTAILLQTERVLGGAFLIEFARGHLPSGFALPAGLGDVAIGLAAPWVADNLVMKKPYAIKVARLWNYLGLFDLVLAVSMGVTHGDSLLGIFAQDVSMRLITQYPLCLIPTWAVPLAVMLHLRSLQSLRRSCSTHAADPQGDGHEMALGSKS